MLSVEGTNALKLAAAAYGRAPKEVKAAIRKEAKEWFPVLRSTASEYAVATGGGELEFAVARSGKLTVNNRGLIAVFASTGRFHGTPLNRLAAPFEFGGNQQKWEKYISRQRTTKERITVTRRAQAQIPPRTPKGRFLYPAVARTTPELVARWIRAIIAATTQDGRYGA